MRDTQPTPTTTDEETTEEIVTDGGSRREPLDPAKALLEDAACL